MKMKPARSWKFYCGLTSKTGEKVNGDKYMVAMKSCFEEFSVTMGGGVWQGDEEPCVVFEVIDVNNSVPRNTIAAVAELLKKQGNQEAIMLVREVVEVAFV